MQKNKVKEKLRQGGVSIGVWHEIGHPDVAEIQAMAGWDFMLYDMEHAPLDTRAIQTCMQVAARYEVTPLVRVAWNDAVLIKQALDIGAMGLLVPMINTADEARRAVQATRYPPEGIRGFGPRRASVYGTQTDDYFDRFAKDEILLIVQIETKEALGNLDGILGTPGVDAAFLGPNDLSISMGMRQQYDRPEFKAAVQLILDKCKQYNVIPAADGGGSVERVKERVDLGFRLLPLAADSDFLMEAEQAAIAKARHLGLVD